MTGSSESARTPASRTGGDRSLEQHTRLLVGAREAREMLGIGERLLAELTTSGAIPSRKINSRRLYSPPELSRWIDAGCPTDAGAASRLGIGGAP